MFRKYDQRGRLLFERHIEGVELDPLIAALPTVWPRRPDAGARREVPLVTPVVGTAAVDPAGNLWVALGQPFTYVYDGDGIRTRVVQFRGAGIIAPASLFFTSASRVIVAPGCYEFRTGPQ
jgi:hypothetical protein